VLPKVFAAMFGNCPTKETVPRIQQDKSDVSLHLQYCPSVPTIRAYPCFGQAAADGLEPLLPLLRKGLLPAATRRVLSLSKETEQLVFQLELEARSELKTPH
jgi:hypothetical protein